MNKKIAIGLSLLILNIGAASWIFFSTDDLAENTISENTTLIQASEDSNITNESDNCTSQIDENSSVKVSDENITAINPIDLKRFYLKDAFTSLSSDISYGWEKNSIGDPFIVKNDTTSTYYLFYSGHDGKRWRIGFATNSSPDLSSWTKYSGNPVLDIGRDDEWDGYHVIGASLLHYPENSTLVKYNGTYWMAYEASNGTHGQIGLASSADLTSWTKYRDNPVITVNSGYDSRWAGDPYLFYDTDNLRFYILYSAKGSNHRWTIALANSTDMQHWTKENSNPIFRQSMLGFDTQDVGSPAILKNNGIWYLFYSGHGANKNLNMIGVAYGASLFNMTRSTYNPIIQISESFDGNGAGDPAVVSDGYDTYVFYNAERFANGSDSTIVRTVNYNPLTISFQGKINDMGNWSRWLAKGNYCGAREWVFISDSASGVYKFSAFKKGVETSADKYETLDAGLHYFEGMYDGSYLTLWKDGTEIASTPLKGRIDATTEPIVFGRENGTSNYLNGSLDEVRFYNRALTKKEISKIVNGSH